MPEAQSFGKDTSFIVRSREPFNGGPAPARATRQFITPVSDFFVRAHATCVPEVNLKGPYTLDVGGLVRSPIQFSWQCLQKFFEVHRLVATMQCAGNRRDQLNAIEPMPAEVPWGIEAISTAAWTGVRLRDVLDAAGVDAGRGAAHVEFIGLDQIDRHGHVFGFGGSVPLDKARSTEVLLAWAMNDQPLAPIHGAPLRVVVPGYIGARSVKWLKQINVLAEPSENYFQSHAYKMFPPDMRASNVDWRAGGMIGEFPINSAITSPEHGATISAGDITMHGWAISGGGRTVSRVEVSMDNGTTWHDARFVDDESHPPDAWSWRLWESSITVSPGEYQLIVRATDSTGNTQPADATALWNFKGYLNNAWHRANVIAR